MLRIPACLWWLEGKPSGAAWLRELPAVVDEVAARWALTIGEPFEDAQVSFACAARRADGTDVVLKVQWPHPECEQEPAALRAWAGHGSVLLLDHDPAHHALLLERCRPGTHLSGVEPSEALEVCTGLIAAQWVEPPPDHGFTALADEAQGWIEHLPARWETAGRPFERRLLDAATDLARALVATQPEQVLVNLDLHGDNVLAAEREPWLAIDPKPVVGERAMSLSPVVRSYELGHSATDVWHRLDHLAGALGVDRERARAWTVVQAVAWSIDDRRVMPRHVDTATWLLTARP